MDRSLSAVKDACSGCSLFFSPPLPLNHIKLQLVMRKRLCLSLQVRTLRLLFLLLFGYNVIAITFVLGYDVIIVLL